MFVQREGDGGQITKEEIKGKIGIDNEKEKMRWIDNKEINQREGIYRERVRRKYEESRRDIGKEWSGVSSRGRL